MNSKEFLVELQKALAKVKPEEIETIARELNKTKHFNKKVLVIGNGGSASIAQHMVCDFAKSSLKADRKSLNAISLVDNFPLLTACANDLGFAKIFANQIETLGMQGDLLFAVSSSGNSSNILEAAKEAKQKGMTIIALTGFDGGQLKKIADLSITIDSKNYGIIESAHAIIGHALKERILEDY